MRTRSTRLALPALLALSGVAVLVGCIPIPVYRRSDGRPRPESFIGPPGSSKPLQLGRSTREDVLRVLEYPSGMPVPQGDSMVYPYWLNTIYWFPCFHQEGTRYLRLEFDDRGILRRYKVYRSSAEANRQATRPATRKRGAAPTLESPVPLR
jgi:hypothetical protein